MEPLLSLRKIRKEFPGCLANDDVDLDILPGEIHALLGENGAGKSTLVKMIYGILKPNGGEFIWNGEPTVIENPNAARELGIGMVFQHFSLFEAMTVAENIALGIPKDLAGPGLSERIIEVSTSYGLPLEPHREVHTLSVGERQRIEIVRCLLQKPKLLIMDEPTSVLTPQEAEKLFETLARLSSEGCAILYISHRLEEIRTHCDKATVLRLGRRVADCDPSQETAHSLAEMMMGADLTLPIRNTDKKVGGSRFQVTNMSTNSDDPFGVSLKNINFSLNDGEILGIAGLAGNGQTELLDMLSGEIISENAGDVIMEDIEAGQMGPQGRRGLGMCFVPEERLGHSAVPDMTLWENGFLSAMNGKNLMTNGFIKAQKARDFADEIVEKFNVKTSGIDHNASSLSGGNLQKFIMGREIQQSPRILIVLQPTWGVDAGSAATIHQELMDLAAEGTAVLVISQDLEELFAVSDRISVICEGRLSTSTPAEETTVEQIGLLMGGFDANTNQQQGSAA